MSTVQIQYVKEQVVVVKNGDSYTVEQQPKAHVLEWSGASGAVSAQAAALSAAAANDDAVAAANSALLAALSAAASGSSAGLADASKIAAAISATSAAAAEAAVLAALGGTSLTSLALVASDRTILAALNTTASYPAILTEGKRGGVFQQASYATYSALVTADTQQGVFVRSTYDTSKVWVRTEFLTSMIMHLLWFGAQFDGSFNDWPAMAGALALGAALPQISTAIFSYSTACPEIRLPYGHGRFYGNTCVTNDTVAIIGQGSGLASGLATMIEWDDGVSFFENNAPGTRIENLAVAGGFAGVESESHAFTGTRSMILRNIYGIRGSGDAIHFDSNPSGSNFDGSQVDNVFFENFRDTIFLDGPDTNVCVFKGVQGKGCRGRGLYDSGFLGNVHVAHQYAGCGVTSYNDGINIPASMVSYSGNWYFVKDGGWNSWCSINPPSGTTADNPGWLFYGAGGVVSGVPAWFSGILCRPGGPAITDNINAAHQLIGMYSEGGQPLAQLTGPTRVDGGAMAGQVWAGSTALIIIADQSNNAARFNASVTALPYRGTDEAFSATLGSASYIKGILEVKGTVTLPGGWRVLVQGNDIVSNYANSFTHFTITGPNTTLKFGRVAAQPHLFNFDTFALGSGVNARILGTSDGTPGGSDISPGEVRFRCFPSDSGSISSAGWVRTTTGAWRTFGGVAAAPTESYIAPSGGTTVDSQCRGSLAQVRNDLADLRNKLQVAGLTA